MEEFHAFNQVGHFDFSFGCFNSAAIQDHTSSALLLLLSAKINLFPLCATSTSGHSCLYNPSDMCRNQMEVNKKRIDHILYIFFFIFVECVVGCSTCRFDNIWPNTQTPIIIPQITTIKKEKKIRRNNSTMYFCLRPKHVHSRLVIN